MTHEERQRIFIFLDKWRSRLLKRRQYEQLTDEEIGQLICLNTIIDYVEHLNL
jgi:hypothetical protein